MHLLAYLFGLSYYVAVPLTLLPEGVLEFGVLKGAYEQVGGWGRIGARARGSPRRLRTGAGRGRDAVVSLPAGGFTPPRCGSLAGTTQLHIHNPSSSRRTRRLLTHLGAGHADMPPAAPISTCECAPCSPLLIHPPFGPTAQLIWAMGSTFHLAVWDW